MEKKKVTKKELQEELAIIKARDIIALDSAYRNINKANIETYLGSGIRITVKNINKTNNVICNEFMISDGLSPDTIKAIKEDIKRSFALVLSYNHPELREIYDEMRRKNA